MCFLCKFRQDYHHTYILQTEAVLDIYHIVSTLFFFVILEFRALHFKLKKILKTVSLLRLKKLKSKN